MEIFYKNKGLSITLVMHEKLSLMNAVDNTIQQEWLTGNKFRARWPSSSICGAQHRAEAQYPGKQNLGITVL